MDYIIDIIKSDLGNILQAGQFMLGSLFLLAVVTHYIGVIQNQVGWTSLLVRLVIGFILLQNYVWLMDTTKDIVVGLDQMINPDQSFVNQYASMTDNLRQQYEENVQQSINFALSQPGVTGLCTTGDITILPLFLQACQNYEPMTPSGQEELIASAVQHEAVTIFE